MKTSVWTSTFESGMWQVAERRYFSEGFMAGLTSPRDNDTTEVPELDSVDGSR